MRLAWFRLCRSRYCRRSVALAVGEPSRAVASARVEVPGVNSLSASGSDACCPRICDLGSKKLHPPRASRRQASAAGRKREAGVPRAGEGQRQERYPFTGARRTVAAALTGRATRYEICGRRDRRVTTACRCQLSAGAIERGEWRSWVFCAEAVRAGRLFALWPARSRSARSVFLCRRWACPTRWTAGSTWSGCMCSC